MGNIIEDEMLSSSVIRDISILDFDYVPEKLFHRDEQLRHLAHMFKPTLTRIAQNIVIKGPIGCGKTLITKKFCAKLIQLTRKNGNITEYVHINCRKRSTDAMVLLTAPIKTSQLYSCIRYVLRKLNQVKAFSL